MSKLQQRLFSTRRFIQGQEGVESMLVSGRQCLWIISRACSVFRNLKLEHIPKSKRDAALREQIPLISPFKSTGYWVNWQEGTASIWLWDQVRQDELLRPFLIGGGNTLRKSDIDFVPESAFSIKRQSGGQLCKASDGYIGQYWRNGKLQAETWWQDKPLTNQWHEFLRNHSLSTEDRPEIESLNLTSATPWKSFRFGQIVTLTNERTIIISIAVFLSMLVAYQITGVGRLLWSNASLESEIERLAPEIEGALALRDRFYQLRSQNRQYADLAGPSQIEMMADIAGILSGFGVTLVQWKFNDNVLELLVADSSPELSLYVEQLEALGWLTAIRVDRVANGKETAVYAELTGSL